MRRAFTPFTERHGPCASVADLHESLGECIARLPYDALPRDRPNFGCSFRDIPPAPYPNMGIVDRLQDIVAGAREEMGEARWNELQAEWSAAPVREGEAGHD